MSSLLLYGANGYTGQLIAGMAASYGLKPILAGRKLEAIKPLADSLGLPFRIFDLTDGVALENALREVSLVLHAAGPFSYTARPMIEACLRTHTHYIDITGEISVYEMAKRFDLAAREAGIMIMPGVGFDVVPTDCLALYLKQKMPDAIDLKLAFASLGGRYSRGTATTMAMGAGEKSAVRKEGKIIPVPLGHKGRWVDFGVKRIFVMTIPWGDISTAFTTTGIPNIETYTRGSVQTFRLLKLQGLYNWILRTSYMRNRLFKKIRSAPAGPTPEQRAKAKSLVWGEVCGPDGQLMRARLTGPEGYTMTAQASLLIAKKILEKDFKTGYQTPAGCYGADLILEIPGTFRENC